MWVTVPNYTLADGVTVKNKLGAQSRAELDRLAADPVRRRLLQFARGEGPEGGFDAAHLKAIHGHLFQDVYEWAGHTRDEKVTLSDGAVASESEMSSFGEREYLFGRLIPTALAELAETLRRADYFRGLPREDFALRLSNIVGDLISMHPFRKGNGLALGVFLSQLAKEAGQSFDFSVVSRERSRQVSIAVHELDDAALLRGLVNEITDPARIAAMHAGLAFFDTEGFDWHDYIIATPEPGERAEAVMSGMTGEYFIARTSTNILIGKLADLPKPLPERGETFMLATPQ